MRVRIWIAYARILNALCTVCTPFHFNEHFDAKFAVTICKNQKQLESLKLHPAHYSSMTGYAVEY